MGKLTSGPEWTDVAMLMSAIGSLHGCEVVIAITAATQGHNGQLLTLVEAHFDLLPGSSLPQVIGVTGMWPDNGNKTFPGHCYNLVFQLDYRISQVYEQMTYIKAE